MAHAVRFEEVTKRYPRGWTEGEEPRYASLRHDVASLRRRLGFRVRGQAPRETGTLALKDVSFEIEEGESYAIIGPNGAGKSTALKLISRISYPTSGRVRIRGRVAALMEVGSGVHPELTGRENIWLYGEILGMSKADIRRRFDEIVEFSELGGAIETPVKFFSTGMQLRLGFSIAAHLEPDVFVVDEALAVGDARFQLRCVRRMKELVAGGHSLIFVSHDLSAVEAICPNGMLLEAGRVAMSGPIADVLREYAKVNAIASGREIRSRSLLLSDFSWQTDTPGGTLVPGGSLLCRFRFTALQRVRDPAVSVGISDERPGSLVFSSTLENVAVPAAVAGAFEVSCRFPSLPLKPHVYQVWLAVHASDPPGDALDWQPVGTIVVKAPRDDASLGASPSFSGGGVMADVEWEWSE
jgi:lipopolysaccharide transport system ATP-binding protein